MRKEVEALEAVQVEVRRLQETVQKLGDPHGRQQNLLAAAVRGPEIRRQIEAEQQRLKEVADRLRAMVALKLRYESLDCDLATQQAIERDNSGDHERYLKYREEAATLEARTLLAARTRTLHHQALETSQDCRHRLEATERRYDATKHATLNARCDELGKAIASESTNRDHLERDLDINREHLTYLERQEVKLSTHRREREEVEQTQEVLGYVRDTIKAAGPAITEQLLRNISQVANDFFAEIMDDHAAELRWDREYEVLVQRGAETRNFAQLSGGEQMSAALAVRLALLKEMSEVNVAFFDEPTQNMDQERRDNLAGQIRQVRGFRQLIVISHDDTFEHDTDNLIRLRKVDGESRVVA